MSYGLKNTAPVTDIPLQENKLCFYPLNDIQRDTATQANGINFNILF